LLTLSHIMRQQRTIKREITFSGIGLHTGREVTVKVRPAARDTGIVFYRKDKGALIRADLNNISDTAFATTLYSGNAKIKTVEHFLAATSGLGIDNLIVEVTGPEMPALDGSAMTIVEMLLEAGIAKQGRQVSYIKVIKPLIYEDAHSRIMCLPYEGRKFSYHIHFDHQVLRRQSFSVTLNEKTFVAEIAPARTFGFLKDLENLRALGLARGGSLDNAIVIGDEGILNPTGLRYDNEFVRHKILDAIGDFALVGYPVLGHFILEKSGHSSNTRFMKDLLQTIECYSFIEEGSSTLFDKPLVDYALVSQPC